MSQSAHYVTQSNIWETQRLGPLTDRKIEQYRKRGWYATNTAAAREEKERKKKVNKQKIIKDLLKDLIA